MCRCLSSLAWLGVLAIVGNAWAVDPKKDTPAPNDPFMKQVKAIKASLSGRDLVKAEKQLKELREMAKTDEQQESVQRMELLNDYIVGFWKAVAESVKGMQTPAEIAVGDKTRIVITEVARTYIVVHTGGQNRRYTIDTVPSGVAYAIAAQWFDKSPKNKLYIGAFYAIDEQGSLEKARSLWQEAAKAGVNIKDILPVLDKELKK